MVPFRCPGCGMSFEVDDGCVVLSDRVIVGLESSGRTMTGERVREHRDCGGGKRCAGWWPAYEYEDNRKRMEEYGYRFVYLHGGDFFPPSRPKTLEEMIKKVRADFGIPPPPPPPPPRTRWEQIADEIGPRG